jgi:hypothetical protein
MSWLSENKFLAGFGAVMLAGVGTLGYFTYSAMGNYETAVGGFESASSEVRRLQELKPFPDDANLKDLNGQKEDLKAKLATLQTELRARALKLEPVRKEAFQDELKQTVARVTAKAAEVKTTLPDSFYMGCGEYQAKPPEDAAAAPLARQLKAIDLLMQVLLTPGGIELKELKRSALPEEKAGAKPAAAAPTPARGRAGQRTDKEAPAKKLVEKTAVKIAFTASDAAFRQVLNNIVGHKQQIFIIRRLEVKNSAPEAPGKLSTAGLPPASPITPVAPVAPTAPTDPAAAIPAAPADAPAQPAAPAPAPAPAEPTVAPHGSLETKFGRERVEATLEIDILDFAEPDAADAKSAGKGAK